MTAILTHSGRMFDFTNPRAEDIHLEDIASGLSKLCRYVGQGRYFYSVAQHSVLVSEMCDPKDALWGLMHDAGEAYMGDINGPLKKLLPEFKRIENLVEATIMHKFGLPTQRPDSVEWADKQILFSETFLLFGGHPWYPNPENTKGFRRIRPWGWQTAKHEFINRFNELTHRFPGLTSAS